MKSLRVLSFAFACLAPTMMNAADGTPPAGVGPETLVPGRPVSIFLAPGRATTVLLRSAQKVSAISLASPVVTYRYDKALNQIELTPIVRTPGVETNLNLRIGADVYVLLVRVVDDVRAEYVRAFTFAADGDEAELSAAPPLAPADIDLVAAARIFERAENDPVFRAYQPRLRLATLGRTYPWNDCQVRLDALAQFLDLDLLVFRVRWYNATADALYLDPRQYSLWSAGRKVPIQARYSPDAGAIVWPGTWATAYLAVQGERLSRHNVWELGLPPSAAALSAAGSAAAIP